MRKQKVKILGTKYIVERGCDNEERPLLKEFDGYCDSLCKKIIVAGFVPKPGSNTDTDILEKRVVRHELIHAFAYESGLDYDGSPFANEDVVDWIACQFPKMLEVFEKIGCL